MAGAPPGECQKGPPHSEGLAAAYPPSHADPRRFACGNIASECQRRQPRLQQIPENARAFPSECQRMPELPSRGSSTRARGAGEAPPGYRG